MKNVIAFILVGLLFCTYNPAFSQNKVKKIKLKGVSGEAIGESIQEVKRRAVNEAKVNALKEAGIKENIKTYTDYFQSETDEQYEELFASNIFTNIQGAVKNIELIDTKRSFTDEGMLKMKVTINCVVLKYLTKNDLTFDYWVKGIEPNYNDGGKLQFSFKPASNGFLKVFMFTKQEAYQLYPNEYEPSREFKKNRNYEFPLKKDEDYTPVREVDYILNTPKRSEMHRIIFVFMKEEIPYTGAVNYEEIFAWIFSIPPDIREVKSFSFTVFNKAASE